MSSGIKRIFHNLRERVVSPDMNREQLFLQADNAETLSHQLNALYTPDISTGFARYPVSLGTPLHADVIGGLLPIPASGTMNIEVTAGKLGCYNPDAVPSTDDSQYKVVTSLGVPISAPLTITANPGGGIRIDVIECSVYENVEESSMRDIFDLGTSAPISTLVDKVLAHRLTFRIREGISGAGFPGAVSGWLPLAVMSVPVGIASSNQATFWDVRPLISDRVNAPFRYSRVIPSKSRELIFTDPSVPGSLCVYGSVETTCNEYLAGGTLFKSSPTIPMGGGDFTFIDVMDTTEQESTFALAAYRLWYIYAAFPFGLPRWARYTETPVMGSRLPSPYRGITIISTKAPDSTGKPIPALTLPTATGLGGTVTDAVMITAGIADGFGAFQPFYSDGRMVHLYAPACNLIAPTAAAAGYDDYTLIADTHYPANARRIRALIRCVYTGGAGNAFSFSPEIVVNTWFAPVQTGSVYIDSHSGMFDGTGTFAFHAQVEIPLVPDWPTFAAVNRTLTVTWNNGVGVGGRTGGSLAIIGWDLSP
jgi:hypothetical protein